MNFGDLLDRDGEGRTPFGEEGDGSGAENGEDVGDVVGDGGGGGGGLENFGSVDDVADEEVFTDEVRHRNRNGGSGYSSSFFFSFDSSSFIRLSKCFCFNTKSVTKSIT